MKKFAYYHIYLTEETGCWYNLFLDQLYQTINSGLYENLEKLYIVCIGKIEEIELFTGICSQFDKIEIIKKLETNPTEKEDCSLQKLQTIEYSKDGSTTIFDETYTMSALQEHANSEEGLFLYFHSKGITAPWRMREEKIYKPFVNYYLWRKFLEWGCIEQWKTCVRVLEEGFSVSGVNLGMWPIPHYSGTFWWSKSSYIKTLPDIKENDWWIHLRETTPLNTWDSNRNKPEMWIGSMYDGNFYSLKDAPIMPPSSCLVWQYFPRSEYENSL